MQLTIGDYPSISLSHARERRQQFRTWLLEGIDPRRQAVLERQKKRDAIPVKDTFDYWEKYYCIAEGIVKIEVNRRDFNNYINPVLGSMIVDRQPRRIGWRYLTEWAGKLSLE